MTDPVFLVTGASSGIGAATARRAAEQGYRVVLGGRRVEVLERMVAELGGASRALAVTCDVTEWENGARWCSPTSMARRSHPKLDPDDVARAVRYAVDQPPGVDINEIVLRPTGQIRHR